jgi:hypothetical protein
MLEAVSGRAKGGSTADFSIARCRSAEHVIIGPTGGEYLILRDSGRALTLQLHGSRASVAAVNTTAEFQTLTRWQ